MDDRGAAAARASLARAARRPADDVGSSRVAVDLPELREPPHLPLEVAPGPDERGERGRRRRRQRGSRRARRRGRARAGAGPPRSRGRRAAARDDVPVEEVHHVERDAEHGLVLADGADLRQPDPVRSERELEPGLAHHVVRRGRQRRPRRPAEDEPLAAPFEQVREVRAAALADPLARERAGAETVLVEECLDRSRTRSGGRARPPASSAERTMSNERATPRSCHRPTRPGTCDTVLQGSLGGCSRPTRSAVYRSSDRPDGTGGPRMVGMWPPA